LWLNPWFIKGYLVAYQVFYVFACIGIFSIAMECCWKKISASQFTLYMTLSNLGRIVGAKLVGPLQIHLGWEFSLLSFAIMIGLAWLLLQFLNIKHHLNQVAALENSRTEIQTSAIPA
jgi:MFS transporter, PAT family, beta-lactamase induction signal transducer AmpG